MRRGFCALLCLSMISTQSGAQGLAESVGPAVVTTALLVEQQNQGSQGQGRNRLLIPGLVSIGAGAALFVLGTTVWRSAPDNMICEDFFPPRLLPCPAVANAAVMGAGIGAMGLGTGLIVYGGTHKNTVAVVPVGRGLMVQARIKLR